MENQNKMERGFKQRKFIKEAVKLMTSGNVEFELKFETDDINDSEEYFMRYGDLIGLQGNYPDKYDEDEGDIFNHIGFIKEIKFNYFG